MMENIFTVDVEEYFHAENIGRSLTPEKIATLSSRVGIGTHRILELLAKTDNRATFFVLGCVAEKNPGLIREIKLAGHEIASHGYEHIPLTKHTPATFEEDLTRSLKILSDVTGERVRGYRATSFSMPKDPIWFLNILKKHDVVYDSSLAMSLFRPSSGAMKADGYFKTENGVIEFPVSVCSVGPLKFPLGGGYFRVCPYWLIKHRMDALYSAKNKPAVFYIHPWELDPGQPRLRIDAIKSLRHYINLENSARKLGRLLTDTRFTSITEFCSKSRINQFPSQPLIK